MGDTGKLVLEARWDLFQKPQDTVIKDHGVADLSCSCRWDGGEAIVSSLGF